MSAPNFDSPPSKETPSDGEIRTLNESIAERAQRTIKRGMRNMRSGVINPNGDHLGFVVSGVSSSAGDSFHSTDYASVTWFSSEIQERIDGVKARRKLSWTLRVPDELEKEFGEPEYNQHVTDVLVPVDPDGKPDPSIPLPLDPEAPPSTTPLPTEEQYQILRQAQEFLAINEFGPRPQNID